MEDSNSSNDDVEREKPENFFLSETLAAFANLLKFIGETFKHFAVPLERGSFIDQNAKKLFQDQTSGLRKKSFSFRRVGKNRFFNMDAAVAEKTSV